MPLNRFLHPAHIRWAVRISEYIRTQKACLNIRFSEYTNTEKRKDPTRRGMIRLLLLSTAVCFYCCWDGYDERVSHAEPVIRLVKSSQVVGLRDRVVFHPYCRHPSDGGAHTDRIRTAAAASAAVRCLAEQISRI